MIGLCPGLTMFDAGTSGGNVFIGFVFDRDTELNNINELTENSTIYLSEGSYPRVSVPMYLDTNDYTPSRQRIPDIGAVISTMPYSVETINAAVLKNVSDLMHGNPIKESFLRALCTVTGHNSVEVPAIGPVTISLRGTRKLRNL